MKKRLNKVLGYLKKDLETMYKNNLASVILYGSQARGDNAEGSDVDILIVLNTEVNPIKELRKINTILSNLSLELNQIISCVFMSKKRYEKEKSPLILNIKKEGVVL